ncbi:MAG: tRNA pseudouridine(38-40) synthase TruA [Deltaproteobacteria bacterium]|jgi:tRNA pseudouridine38-40 synthase|nr:MAG: tRNA pseudouridine(38-40) synthase TruA [Deltaproteobacteria bacterium]
MRNIKLLIEYDGTNYHGWQIQPNATSIQETIENRLQKITQEEIRLIAAGRTDAGVHAIEQVANFSTKSRLDINNIQRGLNSLLPPDIAIKEISEAEQDFHARYSAKSKIYRYVILNRRFPSPLYRNFSWFIPFKLDIKEMKNAVQCLVGEHDFSSFKASGCNSHNPIREVYGISVDKDTKGFIIFEIEANAFLKQMVRNIVGTLTDVGKGKIGVSEFEEILRAKDRKKAGITAPPQGLFLAKIKY